MGYIIALMWEYGAVLYLIGTVFGLAGSVFSLWRYLKERGARKLLESSRLELDKTLARLKHLEDFASSLKQYSAVV
jgi:hypothetical protein